MPLRPVPQRTSRGPLSFNVSLNIQPPNLRTLLCLGHKCKEPLTHLNDWNNMLELILRQELTGFLRFHQLRFQVIP